MRYEQPLKTLMMHLSLGTGGFGKVYRGLINDNNCTKIVALKRLNAESKQGAGEFWTEIKMLSKLRHTHLVSLIGYCNERSEMILVYEYIDRGTLANNLYKLSSKSVSPLTWEQRLKICIGAARGLNYLHAGTNQSFIHRDVKTTNILLNGNWVAKICDFGLSKGTISHSITHVSTDVKGTFGYFDPEYFLTRRLTTKSDVYAFGVVLLEVLCGRPPVDTRLVEEQIGLVEWAKHCIKKGKLDVVIDPSLSGQIAPRSLKSFVELASKCLHNGRKSRPTMAEVLGSLELTLVSQQKGGTEGIISKAFLLMDGWLRFRKDDGSSRGQSKDMTREPDENTDPYSHSSLIVERYRTFVGPDGSSDRAEANISPDSPELASFGSEGHQLRRERNDNGSSGEESNVVVREVDENDVSYSHSSLIEEGHRTFVGPDGSSDRAEANISPDSPEFASFGSEGHQLQRERNDNGFSGEESNVLILVVDENGVSYSRSSLIEEGHWNTASQDVHAPLSVSQRDLRSTRNTEETTAKQVTFSYPFSITEVDDLQVEGQQNESEPNANWVSKNSPYSTSVDDPISSYSPYLPPVIEELSSSYSEAGEDDPLPGIEDLQITGDAFLGNELQACGISLNGTTSCNFEWVRHLEGGSKNYIEGAKQPKYLVTADDVDTVLAIEVQPLDDRKRKGEIVTVFANGHRKITCDPNMEYSIGKTHQNGHASFRVSLKTRYLDIWEPATLAIKSEGYSIKGSVPNGVLVTEKILPTTRVTISSGNATEFSIISSGGVEHRLREENNAKDEDVSCSRDAIVLTLRLFIMKAAERKKGKRRNWNLFGTNQ